MWILFVLFLFFILKLKENLNYYLKYSNLYKILEKKINNIIFTSILYKQSIHGNWNFIGSHKSDSSINSVNVGYFHSVSKIFHFFLTKSWVNFDKRVCFITKIETTLIWKWTKLKLVSNFVWGWLKDNLKIGFMPYDMK